MPDGYLLVGALSVSVRTAVSKPATMQEFDRIVHRYIDRNADVLMAEYFGKRIIFDHGKPSTGADARVVFDLVPNAPTQHEVIALLVRMRDDGVWFAHAYDKPFFWMCAIWLREIAQRPGSAAQRERDITNVITYMCFGWWWILAQKIFPYLPNESILLYTVSRLSRKFKLKQFGNAFDAVLDSAQFHYKQDHHKLDEGSDDNIKNFINGQWSRLNSLFVNFMNEVIRDHKEGNYLNTDRDEQADKGDEGHAEREMTTHNNTIIQMTERTVKRIFTTPPNQRLITISSQVSRVSMEGLREGVEDIVTEFDAAYLHKLIANLLIMFVNDGGRQPREIFSGSYLEYMLQLYGRSNTKNSVVIEIKEQLDVLLKKVSNQYVRTNRTATRIGLRKSIFLYLALMIQDSNRNIDLG